MKYFKLLLVFGIIGLFLSCSGISHDNPKDVVIQLFGAMERNERAALSYLLDLSELMKTGDEDYSLQSDHPRTFHSPEEILDDLTGDGLTKTRWFSMQRVVGVTEIKGDTAFVEVSFVNKEKGVQYYNKFGLKKIECRWKIYSFRTISRQ